MKFVHAYNYKVSEGAINDMPSMTQPNQATEIATMLERHQKGLPVNVSNLHEWDEEEHDEPAPRLMDLTDLDNAKNAIEDLQKKVQPKKDPAIIKPDPSVKPTGDAPVE